MAGFPDGINEERALGALREAWGGAYVVCFDDAPGPGAPGWRAWRLDGTGTALAATTPGELDAAIRADHEDADSPARPALRPVPGEDDGIARWKRLRDEYPLAGYSFDSGFFYGSLRDSDQIERSADLGRLLDKLLAREVKT
jgi:hypothetical protein